MALGVFEDIDGGRGMSAGRRRYGVASEVEVLWRHAAAAALGVVSEVKLTDDGSVLGWLVRCEMRDQASVAESAELVVDDERAAVRSRETDNLSRLSGIKRDVSAEGSGATDARLGL